MYSTNQKKTQSKLSMNFMTSNFPLQRFLARYVERERIKTFSHLSATQCSPGVELREAESGRVVCWASNGADVLDW